MRRALPGPVAGRANLAAEAAAAVAAPLVAVPAVLVAALAVLVAPAPLASASCVESVRWHHVTYLGSSLKHALPLGKAVSGGAIPACNDVGPGRGPDARAAAGHPDARAARPPGVHRSEPVRLAHLEGVPAAVALARPELKRTAFLAPGFFPQLRGYPFHKAIYGIAGDPAGRLKGCGQPETVTGKALQRPVFGALRIAAGQIVVRSRTRFSGRRRAGLPFVDAGDRIVAHGRRCDVFGAELLVASRVRVTRP